MHSPDCLKKKLLKKIENRQALIGVVGLGYVGLPLGLAFAQAGFEVIGIDVDTSKVEMLNQGRSYIEDVPDSQLQSLVAKGLFRAS